ncbi:MAG: hypothetical protein IM638_17800 [Bacteroidetes bacterium]|nr:hypothetical protein [Bacteroidota bacterium]
MTANATRTKLLIFLSAGIFAALGVFFVLSGTGVFSKNLTNDNCLQTGRYVLRSVYLDSMLYVNGSETKRLARLDVTSMFTGGKTITLDFTGSISRRINNGTAKVSYPGVYEILYNAEELTRELSECHHGLTLSNGKLMRNGKVETDTVQNANRITIRNRAVSDFEGTYKYSHDTLNYSYTPSAEWQWKNPFDTLNPANSAFVNYRGGNKVFRFVWIRQQ